MPLTSNGPTKKAVPVSGWVWYEGTDALREGEALCFKIDFGTATERDARRTNHVTRPDADNAADFAGVAARDYHASPTGRFIEIYRPGSRGINIALGANVARNAGVLTYQVGGGDGAGRWVTGKYAGVGSAIPRQTVSDGVVTDGMAGTWTLAVDGVTLTVASTAALAVGGTVVLLGGKNEGSGKAIVPGKYTIASISDATTLVLAESAVGATPVGALGCTGYAYVGNPKCQADLPANGEVVGGAEFLSVPAAGGALTVTPVGLTYFVGELTIGANGTVAFAAGTYVGQRKAFSLLADLTTKDMVITATGGGVKEDGTTAFATITIDDAGEGAFLEFNGVKWRAVSLVGSAAFG